MFLLDILIYNQTVIVKGKKTFVPLSEQKKYIEIEMLMF